MRICVLHPSYDQSESELKDLDPDATPQVYDTCAKHDWSHSYIHKASASRQVRDLSRQGFEVFINLCDGAYDEDRAGKEVVEALERYNCVYTGANLAFYEPSKELMKKMAFYYGVTIPEWAFVYTMDDLAGQVAHLRYPLIVKHYNGYSSIGMGKDSKVDSVAALEKQVAKTLAAFGGALIEEFISGREFTVLVTENPDPERSEEPIAYIPVECKFGAGESFKHFDLKWRDFDSIKWVPCSDSEPDLCDELKDAACAAFLALKGVSYGRCDFRVNEKGEIFFLEINPNCGIFYPPEAHGSADYILTIDPTTSHALFIDHLLQCAITRHSSRQRHVVERFIPGSGFGLYAVQLSAATKLAACTVPSIAAVPLKSDAVAAVAKSPAIAALVPAAAAVPATAAATAAPSAATTTAAATAAPPAATTTAETRIAWGSDAGTDKQQGTNSHSMSANSITRSSRENLSSHSSHPTSLGLENGNVQTAVTGQGVKSATDSVTPSGASAAVVSTPVAYTRARYPVSVGIGFQPGELVVRYEGQSHNLVTREYAAATFLPGSRYANWFSAYAYPITEGVFVTWSEDPDRWIPLNHSCDPNAWTVGLDLVARRVITPGEQITIDYATCCVENLAEFPCRCGTAICRKQVSGLDHLAPWVDSVYKGHLSECVARRRQAQALQEHSTLHR